MNIAPAEKRERLLAGAVAALIVLALGGLTAASTALNRVEREGTQERIADAPEVQARAAISDNLFDRVSITARAAYVYDLSTKTVLYEKNASAQLPLASLTKLMTALVAYDVLSPDQQVAISEETLYPEGNSGLRAGDSWSLEDITAITLIASSNDGAEALASVASSARVNGQSDSARLMNEKGREIGLTETFFTNSTGLDVSGTQGGSYGSARDIARLFVYMIEERLPIVEFTRHERWSGRSKSGELITVNNTNELVGSIPGFIAGKTGLTDLAGGNLVVAFDRGLNEPVVVVVLGSTQEGRFSDVVALARAAR